MKQAHDPIAEAKQAVRLQPPADRQEDCRRYGVADDGERVGAFVHWRGTIATNRTSGNWR